MPKYIHRSIEPALKKALKQFPVLVLTGPRQTGKSTLLKTLLPNYNYITLDDPILRLSAKKDPGLFIDTLSEHTIIDEIQYAPELLPYIKIAVDKKRINGKFVLTGSQIFPLMAGISESLAGRAALFELLGFSWIELKKGQISVSECHQRIFNGFYPALVTQKIDPKVFYSSYITTYLERDIRQIQNVQDINTFQNFLQLLAGRAGNILNLNELAKESGITFATAKRWLNLLETSRIVYLLRPYFKNISKRIVKSPKLYFTDTGLLSYLLRYPNSTTAMSGSHGGALFENMIIIDLLKNKLNNIANEEFYFYRDSNGVEIDLLIDQGRTATAIEIKHTKSIKDAFAKNFNKLPFEKNFNTVKKRLLSLYENTITLPNSVKAIPWWSWLPE